MYEANDNRICCLSNRALGGCRLRHTYDHEGLYRMFGCTLRRHKCNCPWIKYQAKYRAFRQIIPLPFSRGWRGRGKSRSDRGMERFVEGAVAKCMKQMTTAYVVRAIERLKDIACNIRIVREGLYRTFGCTLRRHKCNCPWIKYQAAGSSS